MAGTVAPSNNPGFSRFDLDETAQSIPARFAKQVARFGSHPAVCYVGDELSYQELADRAAHLARALLTGRGADPEPVVLLFDQGTGSLVATLAVLTAGYALSDRASCRGMAHSTDLRERIINAVIHKRYTLQKAADTFDVGAATVSRYLRRYRQTGDLTPRTSPGRPSALNEYQAWVEQSLISNDLTHDQRCDLLFDEIGVRISRATRCRWVQRLGSTRKKDDLRQ